MPIVPIIKRLIKKNLIFPELVSSLVTAYEFARSRAAPIAVHGSPDVDRCLRDFEQESGAIKTTRPTIGQNASIRSS
jgi:hypothetical protein